MRSRTIIGAHCLLDSRNMSDLFTGMITKLNAGEAARVCGGESSADRPPSTEDLRNYAKIIARRNGKSVFITRSEGGILLFEGEDFRHSPRSLSADRPILSVQATRPFLPSPRFSPPAARESRPGKSGISPRRLR